METNNIVIVGSRSFWSMRAHVRNILPAGIQLHYSEDLEIEGEKWNMVSGIVASDQHIDASVMDKYPNLRVISRTGTGYDAIDIAETHRRNIVVTRVSKLNAGATSEFVLGIIFALTKHIIPLHNAMVQESWARIHSSLLGDLSIGLVGLGNIGRTLAQKLDVLGVKRIIGWNRTMRPEVKELQKVNRVEFVELPELFSDSDIIVIALALTQNTKGFIGEDLIARMKNTAFLINVCRGTVIDEDALAYHIAARKIGGAALDVFSVEPPADWTIFEKPFMRSLVASAKLGCNVILTPHAASLTNDVVKNVAIQVAKNISGVLTGNLESVEVVER